MSQTTYLRAPDVVSANMDGEPVIMSLERNAYFGISGIGAFVWDLLEQPHTIDDLATEICARYDVDIDTCHNDLGQLLRDMQENGLIQVV